MIDFVNAILCLGKFLWKFRHLFSCTTRVVPILQATRMVDGFVKQRGHYHDHPVSIRWVLDFGLGRGWPDAPHSLSDRSYSLFSCCVICCLTLLQPNFIYILFNLLLHICFDLPRFRCPFTSSINAFLRMLLSPLLTTCQYHNTPFTFAILSNVSSKTSIPINSPLCFLSTNFTPHINLTMAFYVLLEIAISISLKHHLHII